MFLELHILQNFVPSNLNRDDTGSPKDCDFGGYRRGRVSSQCFKRTIRKAEIFSKTTGSELADRTKWAAELVKQKLNSLGKTAEMIEKVFPIIIPHIFSKLDKDGKTDALVFIAKQEAEVIADSIVENWEELIGKEKKAADAAKKVADKLAKTFKNGITSAPDIALFGRMLASKTGLKMNVDAACQVAHAISTNKLNMEFDYFTAVDDLQRDGDSGSAHLDTTQFNSSCYYRYSNIDLNQLKKNLNGDEDLSKRTVEAFIRASIEAIPTGKQNAFAARQKPEFILAIVRDDMPVNFANAFEKPVQPARNGLNSLVEKSIGALDNYYLRLKNAYGENGVKAKAAVQVPENPEKLAGLNVVPADFETLVKTVMQGIRFE